MSDPQNSDDAGDERPADAAAGSETVADAGGATESERSADAAPAEGGAGAGTAAALAEEPLGESRRLDARVRYQWVVGTVFGSLVTAVVVALAFRFLAPRFGVALDGSLPFGVARLTVAVGAATFAVLTALAVVRAVLLYRSWNYEVREDSLYLTRGVFTRVQTVAPYVRVQHVDTRRSPFERLLGLSSLVVYTAGSRGADVTIPGLTSDRAAELQARLKRLAIASEEEDAV